MRIWPFKKQPYKVVAFDIFIATDWAYYQYAPLQFSAEMPWIIGNNLCIVPEESNVRIKKISIDMKRPYSYMDNTPIKNWKILYRFVDKMEVSLQVARGQTQNGISGNFNIGANLETFSSVNSFKPVNDYQEGIIAGGLEVRYFEILGFPPIQLMNFLDFKVKIYYEDIDENKNLLC